MAKESRIFIAVLVGSITLSLTLIAAQRNAAPPSAAKQNQTNKSSQPMDTPKSPDASKGIAPQNAEQQQTATQQGNPSQPPASVVQQPSPQPANPERDQREREIRIQERIGKFTGVLAVVGVLQIVVIFLQIYLMWGALGATRKAADASTSAAMTAKTAFENSITSFRQQVRPYIVVESTRLNQKPTENVILGIESVLKNTGTTPALNLRVSHIFTFSATLPCGSVPFRDDPNAGSIHIGAGLVRSARTFGQRGLMKAEVDAIEAERLFICYSGIFRYDDIFGDSHQTETCGFYSPPKPGTAVGVGDLFLFACPNHNEMK